jgi:peptide/nickel transport system substrate-binding protein
LIVISSLYLGISYYFKNTKEIPIQGGEYIEGMVGQPRFINPILSQTNDIDSDLSALVYSGLLKLDHNGTLVNDLAESYKISEDNLVYTFHIKKGIKWHDGEELKTDDIIFTIKTIQNSDFNSPLRTSWKGVRVEKIDDYTVKFILKNAYSPFLNNLTVGILPKHLWELIGASNFPLAQYNLQPIGTGPYKFEQFVKNKDGEIDSIEFSANKDYYIKPPFIKKLTFKFFQSEEDLISAFNRKEIKGINYLSPKNKKKIINFDNFNIYRLKIPRYFAIFFNQTKSKALSDKTVRLALAYAINKEKLINEVLSGEGSIVQTPIPQQLLGYNQNTKIYDYAVQHAKNILEREGWIDSDSDGVREKDGVKIEFTLISTDWPELVQTSKLLQEMWKEIGANVKIENLKINEVQNDYIKTREYEALLFGEVLNYDPDPFAFWHSSQKKDPGLNLSLYDNEEVDKLLEEARQEINQQIREEKYRKFQELVVDDIPTIFLYSPNYIYVHHKSIRGVELKNIVIPSNRFNGIENWYVKTKRIWK